MYFYLFIYFGAEELVQAQYRDGLMGGVCVCVGDPCIALPVFGCPCVMAAGRGFLPTPPMLPPPRPSKSRLRPCWLRICSAQASGNCLTKCFSEFRLQRCQNPETAGSSRRMSSGRGWASDGLRESTQKCAGFCVFELVVRVKGGG